MRVAISMHSEGPVRAYQGQSKVDEAHMCPRVQHHVLRLQITVEHPVRMHVREHAEDYGGDEADRHGRPCNRHVSG